MFEMHYQYFDTMPWQQRLSVEDSTSLGCWITSDK